MQYLLSIILVIVIVVVFSILGCNINAEPISNSTIKMINSESPIGILSPIEYNGTNFQTNINCGGIAVVNEYISVIYLIKRFLLLMQTIAQ